MIIKNEKTVFFDVDSTLVKLSTTGDLKLSLYGVEGQYKVFRKNVVQIQTHLARGWAVFAWSNNGPEWAETVLKALDIDHEKENIIVLNKPMKIFDDEDAGVWMPKRVHLHEDEI